MWLEFVPFESGHHRRFVSPGLLGIYKSILLAYPRLQAESAHWKQAHRA